MNPEALHRLQLMATECSKGDTDATAFADDLQHLMDERTKILTLKREWEKRCRLDGRKQVSGTSKCLAELSEILEFDA